MTERVRRLLGRNRFGAATVAAAASAAAAVAVVVVMVAGEALWWRWARGTQEPAAGPRAVRRKGGRRGARATLFPEGGSGDARQRDLADFARDASERARSAFGRGIFRCLGRAFASDRSRSEGAR